MSENRQPVEPAITVKESMPHDFMSIVGTMFACGWNYTIENYLIEEFVNVVEARGYRVDREGGVSTKNSDKEIVLVWEYRGGQWEVVRSKTGLLNPNAKEGERELIYRNPEQLADYIARRTNEWELMPLDDDAAQVDDATPVPENALPVGDSDKEGVIDEEVIEE